MGLINFGVPESETLYLKELMKLDVFVEGGTYRGGTSRDMSSKFNKVYTVEKSEVMFDIAKDNLKGISNVIQLKGDTREHLTSILKENNNILFWLDAHWSGGDTYGEEDECPLLDELRLIFNVDKNYIILIDDARLFFAPPPLPHDYTKWPSLIDILKVIPKDWELLEFEDVIYLFPKSYAKDFVTFMQKKTTTKWRDGNTIGFKKSLKGLFKAIIARKW